MAVFLQPVDPSWLSFSSQSTPHGCLSPASRPLIAVFLQPVKPSWLSFSSQSTPHSCLSPASRPLMAVFLQPVGPSWLSFSSQSTPHSCLSPASQPLIAVFLQPVDPLWLSFSSQPCHPSLPASSLWGPQCPPPADRQMCKTVLHRSFCHASVTASSVSHQIAAPIKVTWQTNSIPSHNNISW